MKGKKEVSMTFEKIFNTDYHNDYYDGQCGWIYLGSDTKHDYYVNHKCKYVSIVYGLEPEEYKSGFYEDVCSYYIHYKSSYDYPTWINKYPYSKLGKLIAGNYEERMFRGSTNKEC